MFKKTKAFSSFSVPDLDEAKEFYGEKLGLAVEKTKEGLEITLGGGGLPLFIYRSDDYNAPEHTVLNFLVDDIDETIDALNEKGIEMEQYPDFDTDEKGISRNDGSHPGPEAIAWFKDPAEHIIAVIQE